MVKEKTFPLRIEKKLKNPLYRHAKKNKRSVNQEINMALEIYLGELFPKKKKIIA